MQTRKIRENSVEQYLIDKLNDLGIQCVKFVPDNKVGMPDRLVLLPEERVIWVELKTKGGALSEVQKYRHKELIKQGQRVETLWSVQDIDNFISKIKKPRG